MNLFLSLNRITELLFRGVFFITPSGAGLLNIAKVIIGIWKQRNSSAIHGGIDGGMLIGMALDTIGHNLQ